MTAEEHRARGEELLAEAEQNYRKVETNSNLPPSARAELRDLARLHFIAAEVARHTGSVAVHA